ncbi:MULTISPECIES: toxin-antitoxin system TumE family protein [Agrobacterium]|uniref:toxin-antitoxin system TumE family protein n=1 Tax=Agrobacterium TaxID=357 RepID=UPI0022BD7578|nr:MULTISPECIES: DUF6516 family protein [Agrobacterium]MCZ7866320.1 DUF6516 family protein [Agrobacterium salinitolerans]MDA5641385.1 DUF6516 family protein [Agrobacterium sp. ST15.13.013]MDA7001579.1 DUF6516 family protein [Agrobacterium salinitolerans]
MKVSRTFIQVSNPFPVGCTFEYRVLYSKDGRRIVGFDNERGKGDHCHLDGDEHPYMFTTTDALLSDFRKEIIKRRKKP